MRKLTGSSYSLIVVLILMLVIINLSMKMEYIASKLVPIVIGITVFILAFIALVIEIRAGKRIEMGAPPSAVETGQEGKDEKDEDEGNKYLLIMAAWIFGFFLGIYLLGFLIAAPIFVGSYMKRHGSSWVSTLITTGIFAVVFYTVFNIVLKADLYKGQLPILLGI